MYFSLSLYFAYTKGPNSNELKEGNIDLPYFIFYLVFLEHGI